MKTGQSLVLAFAAMTCLACAADATTPEIEKDGGTLLVPTQTFSSSGFTTYYLTARFSVSGLVERTLEGVGSFDGVSAELPSGTYDLRLDDGWLLTSSVRNGPVQTLDAELVSDNPQTIQIEQGESNGVILRFHAEGQNIEFVQWGRL
jgi:hypothetical protein